MINIWRQIDTLPGGYKPFLGDKSIASGRRSGGQLMRRELIPRPTGYGFDQFIKNEWHPALFEPRYWMRTDTRSVT